MRRVVLSVFLSSFLLFSGTAGAQEVGEDGDDMVNVMMLMYLGFAEPEACAQLYPELRTAADAFRADIAKQMAGDSMPGMTADSVLPAEAKNEIAGCLVKTAALDKAQCSRLIDLLSTSLSAQEDETEAGEAMMDEVDSLIAKGRPMIAACAAKTEAALRKQFEGR